MTAAPSGPAPLRGIRPSAPRVRIREEALRANAATLAAPGAIADLRRDAWGHGVVPAARAALEAGIEAVVVDDADAVRSALPHIDSARILVAGTTAGTIDLVALYGLPGGGGAPVMRLAGTVLGVKRLLAGEGVSYGYIHRAPVDTHVALVTGGYAQGIVRALGGAVHVTVAATRHPIVGRIAMDVCVVDIGDAAVSRDDEVVYFGDPARGEPSLGAWTAASGLSAAEIVALVGDRADHIDHLDREARA